MEVRKVNKSSGAIFQHLKNAASNVKSLMAPFWKRILLIEKSSFQQFVMKYVMQNVTFSFIFEEYFRKVFDKLYFLPKMHTTIMAPLPISCCFMPYKLSGNGAKLWTRVWSALKYESSNYFWNGAIFLLISCKTKIFHWFLDDFHQKMLKKWLFQHKSTMKKRRH